MKGWLGRVLSGSKPEESGPAPAGADASGALAPSDGPASSDAPASTDAPAPADAPPAVPRALDVAALRVLVRDASELAKGTEIADRGGITVPSRAGSKLFAEAAGSGASPYRVTIDLPPAGDPAIRCTCFAARSRPVCKHGAALLVLWSRAPGSFVVGEAPPEPATGRRTASVKRGKVDGDALLAAGVEQAITLVRDVAVSGTLAGARDRGAGVRSLAETLRANRLRRLSARVVELADLLDDAGRARRPIDPLGYAAVLGDILLTARRIEKHLAGDVLDERQVEELIGKTWRKADRARLDGLELVEYGFLARETADGFVIRERRMIGADGAHYTEKQILPAFLARRTPPLLSLAGQVLAGDGGAYPGYAPRRLDMEAIAPVRAVGPDDVGRILEGITATPAGIVAAFAEHRRDVFAPDALPVAVRADALVALGDRLAAVGPDGSSILLAGGEAVADALEGEPLLAILGDVDLDGILATLHPVGVVAASAGGPALRPVPVVGVPSDAATDWRTVARNAGASSAALALGEVREELAGILVAGLGSLSARTADSLATRMTDLGLGKPAELLREVAARPDPVDRLDDVVRLIQVLGVGATRLAATGAVDRAALVPVPGEPAVLLPAPAETLPPEEVARRRATGRMGAREAAFHRARHLETIPDAAFRTLLPWWADATARDRVVQAVAGDPDVAIPLAERGLHEEWGLAVNLAAVAVIAALPGGRGQGRLRDLSSLRDKRVPAWYLPYRIQARAIRVAAREALGVPPPDGAVDRAAAIEQLVGGSSRDRRADAATALATTEDRRVIPALRTAWRTDPADPVRQAAARALVSLGDLGSVEAFVDALADRERPGFGERAKFAAYALGGLGEARGAEALVDALATGWKTSVVQEALDGAGAVVLAPILRRVLEDPPLSQRQGVISALRAQPRELVSSAVVTTLDAVGLDGEDETQVLRLHALLRLSEAADGLAKNVATRLARRAPATTRAGKALAKAVDRVLNPPPPRKPKV